jgi:hypothetical protein
MKKPAVGLFHNSSAESEARGTEINCLISPQNKLEDCRHRSFVNGVFLHFYQNNRKEV